MTTWESELSLREDGRLHHHAVHRDGRRVSFEKVIEAWRSDEACRSFFTGTLAGSELSAFRWETPPVTARTLSQPFEFVLLDSPWLQTPPDPTPFADHFEASQDEAVVMFPNLGNDALLVVPCPAAPASTYVHLAVFLREAPRAQTHRLWQALGVAVQKRVGKRPIWVSTAGGGVAWLHVRIDEEPKYYGHAPYRARPRET